jgi:hypothetical protein
VIALLRRVLRSARPTRLVIQARPYSTVVWRWVLFGVLGVSRMCGLVVVAGA